MKKNLFIGLLVTNLGWTLWLAMQKEHNATPGLVREPSAPAIVPAEPQAAATAFSSTAPTPLPPASPPFHWNQIESSDYREYIRNLRSIGCPEITIADIIKADVHALYDQRRAQERISQPNRFWEAGYAAESRQSEMERLDDEERAVLTALLGIQVPVNSSMEEVGALGNLRLSPQLQPKQAAVAQWATNFGEQFEAAFAAARGRDKSDSALAHLVELRQSQENALNAILTPDEREEFDLRNSATAAELRSALEGVEVSEDEFRALFRLRDEEVKVMAEFAGAAPNIIEAAQLVFADTVIQLLGPDRASHFLNIQSAETSSSSNTENSQGTQTERGESFLGGIE